MTVAAATVGMRSPWVKGKQPGNKGSCAGRMECVTCLVQLSPTLGGKQEAEEGGAVQADTTRGQEKQSSGNSCERRNNVRVKSIRRKTEQRWREFRHLWPQCCQETDESYLSWAGEGRWRGGGGRTANSLRWRAGWALWLITVVLLWRQTLTAAVLLKCIRILLLGELTVVYCKKSKEGEGRVNMHYFKSTEKMKRYNSLLLRDTLILILVVYWLW